MRPLDKAMLANHLPKRRKAVAPTHKSISFREELQRYLGELQIITAVLNVQRGKAFLISASTGETLERGYIP